MGGTKDWLSRRKKKKSSSESDKEGSNSPTEDDICNSKEENFSRKSTNTIITRNATQISYAEDMKEEDVQATYSSRDDIILYRKEEYNIEGVTHIDSGLLVSQPEHASTDVFKSSGSKLFSTESTGQLIMSTNECVIELKKVWEHLRKKLNFDHAKYSKQMLFLDYLHSCTQASEFLKREDNDSAKKYCDAAKALVSNHWYAYNIKAEIWKATGEYDKAQLEMNLMRKYMKDDNKKDTIESLAIYYGFKIDTMLTKGEVGDAKKKFRKVIELLKQHSQNDGVDSNIGITQSFEDVSQTIEESSVKSRFSLFLTSSIKKRPISNDTLRNLVGDAKERLLDVELRNLYKAELDGMHEQIAVLKDDVFTHGNMISEVTSNIDSIQHKVEHIQEDIEHIETYLRHLSEALKEYENKITRMLETNSDHNILKDQLEKISSNPAFQEYFKAFILTFTQAYSSAQVVLYGDTSLNTEGILETVAVNALGFIPFCGNTLSIIAEQGIEVMEGRIIRENAACVVRMATNHTELYEIIKIVAKDITLHEKKYNELLHPRSDENKQGFFKKLLGKIKEVASKVSKSLDGGEIYKTSYAELGYEDASNAILKWIKYVKESKANYSFFAPTDIMKCLKNAIIEESEWPVNNDSPMFVSPTVKHVGHFFETEI